MSDVTVLMPVFNGERFLKEAIGSILRQTFRDFEFLIVNDGSTDKSPEIIRNFEDPRIRVLHNSKREKLSGALNRGIREANGKLIARMDADDIALPRRLEEQISFMEKNPQVGVCGTAVQIFGKNIRTRKDIYPENSKAIRPYALFDCPFCHPTVMIRKTFIMKFNLQYDGSYYPTEDYEIWSRAADLFPTANLKDVLMRYRVHDKSMTGSDWERMDRQAARVARRRLEKLGINISHSELEFHRHIGRGKSTKLRNIHEIDRAENWLRKLIAANAARKCYDPFYLMDAVALVWFRLCSNNAFLGKEIVRKYAASVLTKADGRKGHRVALILMTFLKTVFYELKKAKTNA